MAGVVLALVGIAVLVVAVIALRDPKSDGPHNAGKSVGISDSAGVTPPSSPRPSSGRSASPTASTPSSAPAGSSGSSAPVAGAKALPLVVLNNTTVAGLAKQAARRFEAGGWTVTSSGNLSNDIVSTCAYYDPDVSGAKAAAQALQDQYPTIKRVAPKFPELPSGPVVVVLTPDYSSD